MRVGIIMGGVSSEKEVSIKTGKEMMMHLDSSKYDIVPIVLESKEELVEKVNDIDIALLALHGKYGEDGTIQGTLETLGIPYTGCNLLSSAISMDKDISKKLMKYAEIPTAQWLIIKDQKDIDFDEIAELGYPVVIKPNSGGSSIATTIVNSPDEIIDAVKEALKYDHEVMIEQFLSGDEITCPVLDGKLLPTLVIKPKSTFFDYASKYDQGGAEEVVIELPEPLKQKVEYLALQCYELMKCQVYARIDMIIHEQDPYVLEINTLPGMTSTSLFPKSANAVGMSFSELLDRIIKYSLKK